MTEQSPPLLSEDNLLTAARRLIRFVRTDDHNHGGLLSIDTIQAAEHLSRFVDLEVSRLRTPPSPPSDGPAPPDAPAPAPKSPPSAPSAPAGAAAVHEAA